MCLRWPLLFVLAVAARDEQHRIPTARASHDRQVGEWCLAVGRQHAPADRGAGMKLELETCGRADRGEIDVSDHIRHEPLARVASLEDQVCPGGRRPQWPGGEDAVGLPIHWGDAGLLRLPRRRGSTLQSELARSTAGQGTRLLGRNAGDSPAEARPLSDADLDRPYRLALPHCDGHRAGAALRYRAPHDVDLIVPREHVPDLESPRAIKRVSATLQVYRTDTHVTAGHGAAGFLIDNTSRDRPWLDEVDVDCLRGPVGEADLDRDRHSHPRHAGRQGAIPFEVDLTVEHPPRPDAIHEPPLAVGLDLHALQRREAER